MTTFQSSNMKNSSLEVGSKLCVNENICHPELHPVDRSETKIIEYLARIVLSATRLFVSKSPF